MKTLLALFAVLALATAADARPRQRVVVNNGFGRQQVIVNNGVGFRRQQVIVNNVGGGFVRGVGGFVPTNAVFFQRSAFVAPAFGFGAVGVLPAFGAVPVVNTFGGVQFVPLP